MKLRISLPKLILLVLVTGVVTLLAMNLFAAPRRR
jgi:hypothetical protein